MEDITDSILSGKFKFDNSILEQEDEHISTDPDPSAPTSKVQVEQYQPSILTIDSADEIKRLMDLGIKFREDDDQEEKRVINDIKLSQEELDHIQSNPAISRILSKLRPDQLTPEIVRKLLRLN